MDNICFIPTKNSSTRLKNKNIASYRNGNLITHTIEQAIESNIFNRIILSSNDINILKMTNEYGIESYYLEDTEKQIIGVTKKIIKKLDLPNSASLGILLVTGPLRLPEDIVEAYNLFIKNKRQYPVVSVKKNENPVQMAFKKDLCGHLKPIMPKEFYRSTRKQDHYDTFYFNDAIIFDLISKFKHPNRTLYGNNPIPYVMPWERSIGIDYQFQLDIVRCLGENNGEI